MARHRRGTGLKWCLQVVEWKMEGDALKTGRGPHLMTLSETARQHAGTPHPLLLAMLSCSNASRYGLSNEHDCTTMANKTAVGVRLPHLTIL